jgi:hypothetical protein
LHNQELIFISVWQLLALAGIGKQLLPLFDGIDHGIAALNISMALQPCNACRAVHGIGDYV